MLVASMTAVFSDDTGEAEGLRWPEPAWLPDSISKAVT
jgi:hypothetical protein